MSVNLTDVTKFISSDKRTVRIVGTIPKDNKVSNGLFLDGKGYISENNDTVWIYAGSGKPRNPNEYPYFWIDNGEIKFSNPNPLILSKYNITNIKEYSKAEIIAATDENEELFDESILNDINSSTSVFTPVIKSSDDFLKKIVKTVIIKKGINVNRLKSKTDEKYEIANLKAALVGKTKMSTKYFISWMELLGCDFNITVNDGGVDSIDPLKVTLFYQSYNDKVSQINSNGEIIDINEIHEEDDSMNDN
jgi:hypothetical protein